MIRRIFIYICFAVALASCRVSPHDVRQSNSLPDIYPDYTDVTVPVNIAPLNFLVRGAEAVVVKLGAVTISNRGEDVVFDEAEWRNLLSSKQGGDIEVSVTAKFTGVWIAYKPFKWHVVNEKIDPWLTYRLIEPMGDIYGHLRIMQRCLENFEEIPISDYHLEGDRCMNCHIPASQDANLSLLYLRGEDGGAVLNQHGKLRKLNLKTMNMVSNSTYFCFSPSGRYIVFSCNDVIPIYHANPYLRYEVYDTVSDIYIADIQENKIFTSPLLKHRDWLETFPTFSPDGKYIYYCTAKKVALPEEIKKLDYALVRIPFSESTGTIGSMADTLYKEKSVCHPRVSPDGKRLLFTTQDYGTFPIHHHESDLRMIDLSTREVDSLLIVNSNKCDTYHSWSSNSRWFVFVSKRDDGLYGLPYICYVDEKGVCYKPFCLPQKNPYFYDDNLYSFNVTELVNGRVPIDAIKLEDVLKQTQEEFLNIKAGPS